MSRFAFITCLLSLPVSLQAVRRHRSAGNSTAEAELGWTPCPRGMCWNKWGKNAPQVGAGGIGNKGCKRVFGGCKEGEGMKCYFGPCPKYFGESNCVSSKECRSYCDVSHASTCRYSGPQESSSYSTWMSKYHSVKLKNLVMVEAHHALARLGTLDFTKPASSSEQILGKLRPLKYIPGLGTILNVAYNHLLPMFSSTQSSGITTLLKRGVRAFDLRPFFSKKSNKLFDEHGGRGPEIEPALAEVAAFVKANPSELVFINFQNVRHGGDGSCLDCQSESATQQKLVQAVKSAFGDCGGVLHCGLQVWKTVGELVGSGNVVVHSGNQGVASSSGGAIHYTHDMYRARWYDKNSVPELAQAMLGDSYSQSVARSGSKLIGHQWLMTPQTDDFVGAITQRFTGEYQDKANKYGCQSLACFAEVASAKSFNQTFSQIKSKYARSNFLLLDYADRAGTMAVVLSLNNQQL